MNELTYAHFHQILVSSLLFDFTHLDTRWWYLIVVLIWMPLMPCPTFKQSRPYTSVGNWLDGISLETGTHKQMGPTFSQGPLSKHSVPIINVLLVCVTLTFQHMRMSGKKHHYPVINEDTRAQRSAAAVRSHLAQILGSALRPWPPGKGSG